MNEGQRTYLALALLLGVAFLVRVFPGSFENLVDPDAHFHARMAEQIITEQRVPAWDALSMQGRVYTYPALLHVALAGLSIFSGLSVFWVIKLFSALYGTLSVLGVFLVARRLFNARIALASALFVSATLLHVLRTDAFTRPDGMALAFIPFVLLAVLEHKWVLAYLSGIALVLLHPLSTIHILVFLLAWVVLTRVKKWGSGNTRVPVLGLVLLVFGVWVLWAFSFGLPLENYASKLSFESSEFARFALLDFAVFFSVSWVFALAVLVGRNKIPVEQTSKAFLGLWLVVCLAFAFWGLRLGLYLSLPLSILAGLGLVHAFERVRPYYKAFVGVCAVLFLVTLIAGLSARGPYQSLGEGRAMEWVKENTPFNASIFSAWDRGHQIAYFTRRPVVIDGYFEFAPQLVERNRSMWEIITTANCSKIALHMNKWDADYFFVHRSALKDRQYQNGILEARCPSLSSVYASDDARVLEFNG
ncbi:MAG: hypothetical protein HY393_02735 [Candidatus Diapherotrites archaeon]|nr:hypothetical protein [Candidatus Diapherotrites archaeon]